MTENPIISDNSELFQYMKQLDGLRAIAIITVLYSHYSPKAYYLFNIDWGAYGVRLFFVLSGFLITGILLKCRQDIESEKQKPLISLRQFYIRRFLRIFPLYYLTLAVGFIINVPHLRESIVWHLAYLSNIYFGIHNNWFLFIAHFWSLAVEEQFYIFWPWLVIFLPKRLLLPAILILILAGPIFRLYALIFDFNLVVIKSSTPAVIDTLGFGSLLAYLNYREKTSSSFPYFPNRNKNPNSSLSNIGKIYLIIGLSLLIFVLILKRFQDNQFIYFIFRDTALGLIFTWLVAGAANGFKRRFGKFLEFPLIIYLGKISYGVYVIHYFILHLVSRLLNKILPYKFWNDSYTWLVVGVISTIITIGLAMISWKYFEKPINDLKRYFPYNPIKSTNI
ncbi:acyltransferase [Kamptonema animale CS-326]|jgi:peptidoglycan/LPS O-acetylase OafA/YrhL|uniref:acyltransferase family protein n=1 Tax=Kamptonema animale TaxID=92934 RepID=UPI00232AB67F|nr:acyltransferase [Kamptonema animale]MDB9514442.1 acyltransferase [Kamptonema animale CS-326]